MPNYTRRPHPSNRLQDNDVRDFTEAMQVYQLQMDFENKLTEELCRMQGVSVTPDDRRAMGELTEHVREASEAMAIYNRHIESARKAVIAELRAKSGTFEDFADALESDDYSSLAI